MRIEPTVGRTVHLILANPDGIACRIGQPLCAQIAAVLDTGRINIGFLDYNGVHSNMVDLVMAQPGEDMPAAPYCKWVDYQVDVARREASDAPGEAFPIGGGTAVPLSEGTLIGQNDGNLQIQPAGSIIETLTDTGQRPPVSEADAQADLNDTKRPDDPTGEHMLDKPAEQQNLSSADVGSASELLGTSTDKPAEGTTEQPLA